MKCVREAENGDRLYNCCTLLSSGRNENDNFKILSETCPHPKNRGDEHLVASLSRQVTFLFGHTWNGGAR